MPLYQYVCGSCERVNEYLLRSPEALPESCTSCGYEGESFEKVWHGAGFAAITGKTQITPDGHKHIIRNRDGALEGMEGLRPGINITCGVDSDGDGMTLISRVNNDGRLMNGEIIGGPFESREQAIEKLHKYFERL